MQDTVIIVGNLGRDPEMRYTPSGQAVTNISVATNKVWTDDTGAQQKRTTWWRVSFWGKVAETINTYFKKGDPIYIQGHMNPDPATGGPKIWSDTEGKARASYELVADQFGFISGGRRNGEETKQESFDAGTPKDDNIPF